MVECIWKVAGAEDRLCQYCAWDRGCVARKATKRSLPSQAYFETMNKIVGVDVVKNNSWLIAHYRFMIAFAMRMDGFRLAEIGDLMGKNHSTISHGVTALRDMLSLPEIYSDEAAVWQEYQKQINLLQDEYYK